MSENLLLECHGSRPGPGNSRPAAILFVLKVSHFGHDLPGNLAFLDDPALQMYYDEELLHSKAATLCRFLDTLIAQLAPAKKISP